MKYIKKFISRIKSTGIKNSTKYYFNLTKNYFYVIIFKIIDILPLRNTIVFECESDMDDNPRAIYEYILREKKYKKYKLVWVVKNLQFCRDNYKNNNTVFVSRISEDINEKIKFNYYMSTAKIFLFSHPWWFKKKKPNQLVINTTHGTPFKAKKMFNNNISDLFDYTLTASEYTRPWFLKILNCPIDKSFISPHPRNDLLTVGNKKEIFSKLFDWNSDEKVIMCMPTFKQSKSMLDCTAADPYALSVINTEEEFFNLNNFLAAKKIHLLIKLHPLQLTDSLKISNTSNIHYVQNEELFKKKIVLYSLIGCCDGLITDFSSVLFDYIILNQPVAFFTNFFEQYERGYIMDNPKDYMCGEKINFYKDIINFIDNISNNLDIYKADRQKTNSLINGTFEKNACKNFVNLMFELYKKNK